MIKLLIVEDERWEREGLARLFDWPALGIDQVRTASDGFSGIDEIRTFRPDLVITDIRMPGMNGLVMLETCANELKDSKVIILSGYADFEYARSAIHLGVTEYVLKPFSETEMQTAIQRVLDQLPETDPCQTILDELLHSGRIPETLLSCLHSGMRAIVAIDVHRQPLISQQTAYIIDSSGDCLILQKGSDILPIIQAKYSGIADLNHPSVCLRSTFRQARRAAHFARFWNILAPVHVSHLPDFTAEPERTRFNHASDRIIQAVKNHQKDIACQAVSELCHELKQEHRWSPATIIHAMMRMWQSIERHIPSADSDHDHPPSELLTLDSIAAIEAWQIEALSAVMANESTETDKTEAYVVSKVLDLVHERFAESDLTLRKIAQLIFLSPNYTGQLFKKQTGMNFSDYLSHHRMLKARDYLRDPSRKISWAARNVGIPNTSYFSVLFKNEFGLTPTQYRRHLFSHLKN